MIFKLSVAKTASTAGVNLACADEWQSTVPRIPHRTTC